MLLKEREGERYLPIWIGAAEAAAIALSLQGVVTPAAHDPRSAEEHPGGSRGRRSQRIVVTELRDSTFYATIDLQRNGDNYEISSRPSDAIALAVRLSVPIFASEEVLDEASILIPGDEDEEVEKFREFLDNGHARKTSTGVSTLGSQAGVASSALTSAEGHRVP